MGCLHRLLAASGCLLAAFATLPSADANADAPRCRIAFDLGSSGIRAGASTTEATAKSHFDYLAPLYAGKGAATFVSPTVAALRELPAKAGLPAGCAQVGGGFSAWRLAFEKDAGGLAEALAAIRAATGVAILVIPPRQEGAYGHFAARTKLGARLATSHVLDIGGGSLQIAGEQSTYAAPLGQKTWQRELCRELRQTSELPCALQPLAAEELARAREIAAEKLAGVAAALPAKTAMTAISRPVTRGVAPAARRLTNDGSGPLTGAAVAAAIDAIAPRTLAETTALTGATSPHAAFLLSDLLLVEGLLRATGDAGLEVAETDLTNLPGILADDRAYAWGERYACYLQRLAELGADAYASDPASCPAAAER